GGVCAVHVGEGEACAPQEQGCDTLNGFRCDSKTKICQKFSFAGPGEACGFNSMSGEFILCSAQGQCATGMGDMGVCKAPVADGAACTLVPDEGDPCTAPARCVNSICSLAAPTCP
ncbi:MAG: hypothetical protein ABI193_16345, partial [Minicystis sp.]